MPINDGNIGLARDLTNAIDDLQTALQSASDATAAIRSLVPRVAANGSLFDELEAVIRAGREQIGAPSTPAVAPAVYSRPTLVVPSAAPQRAPQPWAPSEPSQSSDTPVSSAGDAGGDTLGETQVRPQTEATEALTCFRLEFESTPGPLDLRTVDDAVSEHPDVRDVALLDYDGRKATLKVWIVATAQPSQVQESLTERASQLFGASNEVSVVALEDVA